MTDLKLAELPRLTLLSRYGTQFLRLLPKRVLSRCMGWLASCPVPRPLRSPVLGFWARLLGIDLREAARGDLRTYRSLQELFTRELAPGARTPPQSPDHLHSPVDGMLSVWAPVEDDTLIQAKGLSYGLEELLASRDLAGRFRNGTQAVFYLSPKNYHRVHTPLAMRVQSAIHLPGTCMPVFPPSVQSIPKLFARNERVVFTGRAGELEVALVMVAAFGVGNMRFPWMPTLGTNKSFRMRTRVEELDRSFAAGEEIGIFALGSTVILLLSRAKELHLVGSVGPVQVHQPLARIGGL